ncbi:MAG: SsrA-binding protein SmpB [Bacteroidetes bacterium]|nr:SsrA-binding protein SmpB [Bacteroidota bacterium]
MSKENRPVHIDNRRARHEYSIEDTLEAGLVLQGTEVKSLRDGKANLSDAYARIINGEVFIIGMHVSIYEMGSYSNHDPLRSRKCLLHSKEITKIKSKIEKEGFTLVPLKIYFNSKGIAKVELGICKGKKLHDKRDDIKDREVKRELDRARREKG